MAVQQQSGKPSSAFTAGEPAVLIVGAGPTGLVLAGELARHGVVCRIIDEAGERQTAPRAINIHARTREIFADLGIADEIEAQARIVRAINVHSAHGRAPGSGSRHIAHIGLHQPETRFPTSMALPQPITERVLEDFVECGGMRVERGVRCVSLRQDPAGVDVELEDLAQGAREQARFAWVVGCDGARSTVREALGLSFEGTDYDWKLVLADVHVDWARRMDEAQTFLSPHGTLNCMPMPVDGRWRIVADVPARRTYLADEALTLESVQRLAEERGAPDAVLSDASWLATSEIRYRLASRFRVERVFLAGDAAHVHSPLGAQGMNIGIQDAYNLAWKLALVIRGAGRLTLLDSYEAERRPIAQQVIQNSDRSSRLTRPSSARRRIVQHRIFGALLRLAPFRRRMARGGSELAMNYRGRLGVAEHRPPLPAVIAGRGLRGDASGLRGWQAFGRGPAPGDRVPDIAFGPPTDRRYLHDVLQGTRHVLLLFAGRAAASSDWRRLGNLARDVADRYVDEIAVHVVIPGMVPPADLDWTGSLLLDPDQSLHTRWGAAAPCLVLVRPDGYVGYRALPPDHGQLERYFSQIFV
jgi:2-polyprenyl-6-methoxyphenol hydroxylase-like FAD-dependent oxidoreductase